jgi:hypothetical protein
MTTTAFKVGDKVSVDDSSYPGVWTIIKQGPVNSTLRPENGGRNLRAPHYMLRDAGAAALATVTTLPTVQYFEPGEFVRVNTGKYTGLFIVLADKGEKVNITRPGGDGGRYVRMPKSLVSERVDPSEVLK